MGGRIVWRNSGLALTILTVGILAADCGGRHGGTKSPAPCDPTVSQIAPDTGDISGGELLAISTSCFQDDFTLHTPQVFFGSVPAFLVPVDSDSVAVISPPHPTPEVVDVEVRSTGVLETATLVAGFTYTASPCTIAGVTPSQGSTSGGDTVVIDGAGFDQPPLPLPTVEFGLGNPSPRVVALPGGQLEVETPAGSPGLVDVIVTTQAGSCARPGGFEYLAPPSCTVTTAYPRQGFMDRVTTVTLMGAGFDEPPLPEPTVEFGPGNYGTNVSGFGSNTLVVDAPTSMTAGFVDVIVTNQASQCAVAGGFEYLAPPPAPPPCTISTIDPTFGPDFGGNSITIHGTDFTIPSRVWMGTVEVTPVFLLSETELRITAPPGVGTVGITVDIGGGITCSLPFSYEYISCVGPSCQLQRAVPNRASPGDLVTISGTGFELGAQVFFGNAPELSQAVVFDDTGLPTDLLVIVPPQVGPDSTVDIHVVNRSGVCCTRANGFTYGGCFIVSALPDQATPAGNSTVLITGEGFPTLGGPLPEVWFGTEQCTFVNRLTQEWLQVMSPPAAGQSVVEITVIFPTGEICSKCCYSYFPECELDGVVPDSGGTNGGDLLTLTGYGLEPDLTGGYCVPYSPVIRFGDVFANPNTFDMDPTGTMFSLISPPSFTGGPKVVRIENYLYFTECTLEYTYVLPGGSPCSITEVDPDIGWKGDWVTIRGDGFDPNSGILFGDSPTVGVFISPQELRVGVPCPFGLSFAGGDEVVDVVVAPQNSDPCMLAGGFTYSPPACDDGDCEITAASPNSGPLGGGNTVTITGDSFCDPEDDPRIWVEIWFGLEVVQATYLDETTLSVVAPPSVTGPGLVDLIFVDATGCAAFCMGCYTYN